MLEMKDKLLFWKLIYLVILTVFLMLDFQEEEAVRAGS